MHTGHTTTDQGMFAAYCALPDGSMLSNQCTKSLFNAVMRIESNFIATEFRLIIEGSAAHRIVLCI